MSGMWPITQSATSCLVCVSLVAGCADWLLGEQLTGKEIIFLFAAVTVGGLIKTGHLGVLEKWAFTAVASLLVYLALHVAF